MDLGESREAIRAIDQQIADLFVQRMEAARDVASYKRERGLPIEDKQQEARVLADRGALVEDDELRAFYLEFLQDTMDVSKRWQHHLNQGEDVAHDGVGVGENAAGDASAHDADQAVGNGSPNDNRKLQSGKQQRSEKSGRTVMQWISKSNVLIVGLGLMGGSYAMALKRLGYHVSGLARRQETIDYAVTHGIIDEGSAAIDAELIGAADAVVFALYPTAFKDWIRENQHLLKPGALLTDVTGVKRCIVYDIQAMLRDDVEFIAAHPMAGKEVYGVENSDDRIFHNANYIVTPTEANTPEAIEWCQSLGRILGFRKVSVLTPEQHDEMIGFLSQLTHCIAVTLMTCSDNRHLVDYTGDSFRDLTRIARINDAMWSELFELNKDDLLEQMNRFLSEFTELRDMLERDDVEGMRAKMRLSTERRAYFD